MRFLKLVSSAVLLAVVLGAMAGIAAADPETFHIIQVSEVFSNADGTVQFIELKALSAFQTQLQYARVNARNADGTVITLVRDFTATFPALDNNETILLATAGAATALGFAPDFIIPSGSVPLHSGRIEFDDDFNGVIDGVAYGNYTGDMTGYGTPAPALPCDGYQSLTRLTFSLFTKNNAADFTTAENSPTRNDGSTGLLGVPNPTPPVLAAIATQNMNEGAALNLLISATDCNGTFPAMSGINLPANSSFTPHANGTGNFVFNPVAGQFGTFVVDFIASDGTTADTAAVTIKVNALPIARDTSVTTPEDTPVGAQLQAYDPDAGTLSFIILTGPFHGATSGFNPSTGTFNYTPNPNYSGPDTITFRVNDGTANSSPGTVGLTVTAVNDAPVAVDVSASTSVNLAHTFGAMPVTDVDNVSWTITHASGPFHGSVSSFDAATGAFVYTPALNYQGSDSIRYHANDGSANSNTATIRITVVSGCACPSQGDINSDAVIDVFDVIGVIGIAFSGDTDPQDAGCPKTRGDVNNDGATDVFDVIYLIATAFSGGPDPVDPCAG
ncbi:MAG: tandem-95 repeat protein [candidate division Zixibacteria bacterium]|nr:tandem-95 repeat protein [candidate division Zixibacteria bacterium]